MRPSEVQVKSNSIRLDRLPADKGSASDLCPRGVPSAECECVCLSVCSAHSLACSAWQVPTRGAALVIVVMVGMVVAALRAARNVLVQCLQ